MRVFIFGFGYVAAALARHVPCVGTKRLAVDAPPLFAWHGDGALSPVGFAALRDADCVLITVPPNEQGDPVFHAYASVLMQKKNLWWLGYISTTGVYGDSQGAWVDENTPPAPDNDAGKNRLLAENQWLGTDLPVHIFRAAGIYGPGRSPLDRARAGALIITKDNHVMNRIHVDDIAAVLMASIKKPNTGGIYNLADDEPAASSDVLRAAYDKLGLVAPAPIPFDKADLTPMGRGFFSGCKRIANKKIKTELGVALRYPTWREGLDA